MAINLQYYGPDKNIFENFKKSVLFDVNQEFTFSTKLNLSYNTDVVVLQVWGNKSQQIFQIQEVKRKLVDVDIIFVVIGEKDNLLIYLQQGAHEVFEDTTSLQNIERRLKFLIDHPIIELHNNEVDEFKIPLWKRIFDICFAGINLILLTPLFILIAVLIRIESKGPIFYASKRVGAGYKVFNFYKFRSMYQDADKRVQDLLKQNQYNGQEPAEKMVSPAKINSTILYDDNGEVNEEEFLDRKKVLEQKAFFKLNNDPRITKVGRFIRNTSIDELPQFINVLKGDMSIVGNRPLPLYEAEKLTKDPWIKRYLAPAGLTGLWQVTARAKNTTMSAEERKMLDVTYANNYNLWTDLVIIFKTIPAMLQHENV